MNRQNYLQPGLDILRREARCGKRRSWRKYADLMRRAEEHVLACGGNWSEIRPVFAREIANILRL